MKKIIALLVVFILPCVSLSGEKQKATIAVKGMYCSSCVSMIKKSIRKVQGVESVLVNLDSAHVQIEYTNDSTLTDVFKALTRMGYKVANPDSLVKKEVKVNH